MTVRDFVLIAIGEIILASTFGLGILVGVSLSKRRDSHDHDSYETAKEQWHNIATPRSARCPEGRCGSRADTTPEARVDQRAAARRHHHG